jgi:hypothetical protein
LGGGRRGGASVTAPAAWVREAYERRDILAAQGVHITIVTSAWGVTMWADGVEEIGRSWSALDAASINPLIPTIETITTRLRRAVA